MRRDSWHIQVTGEWPPRYFSGFAFSAGAPQPCWTCDLDTAEIFYDVSQAYHAAGNCGLAVSVTRRAKVRE